MDDLLLAFINTLDLSLKRFQRDARDRAGSARLTLSQLQYLDAIFALGTPTLSLLARRLGVTKASATIGVNRLAALGYVLKNPSETDGRAIQVRLTAPGLRLAAAKGRALEAYAAQLEISAHSTRGAPVSRHHDQDRAPLRASRGLRP